MSNDLILLEMLARGAAIGALIALAIGLGVGGDSGGRSARIAGVVFCIGVIAYVLNSSPYIIALLGWLAFPVHFMALGGAGLFWLFIVTLFEDRPITLLTLSPWLVLTGVGLLGFAAAGEGVPRVFQGALWIIHNLIEATFSLHALAVVIRGWRGDLVEERRRLRGPFTGLLSIYVILLSGFEIAEILGFFHPWFRLLGGATLALSSLCGIGVFMRARREVFGASLGEAPAAEQLDPADRAVLTKLDALMTEGEAWRREGLTIGAVAEQVGVPEHRLRRLINDHLGFRNFAAFVNERRIGAAKRLLTDPAHARQTVAALAFDLGFGSLGPFNRAFKEATGLTPTEFRRNPAQQASPISKIPG